MRPRTWGSICRGRGTTATSERAGGSGGGLAAAGGGGLSSRMAGTASLLRRRSFALAGLGTLFPLGTARAQDKRQLLGDMHSHATMFQRTVGVDLRREMEETGTAL